MHQSHKVEAVFWYDKGGKVSRENKVKGNEVVSEDQMTVKCSVPTSMQPSRESARRVFHDPKHQPG